MESYVPRTVDAEIDELFEGIAAISLDGPKAVGKTETARRRVAHTLNLDNESQRSIVAADPQMIRSMPKPLLVDEWQRVPSVWEVVRRAVDDNPTPDQFILAGSAGTTATLHSGAGRIVRVRMRPMSIAERVNHALPVSLATMLTGHEMVEVRGHAGLDLGAYVDLILESGFPGIRSLSGRVRTAQLGGYLDRIVDRDFEEQGVMVCRPGFRHGIICHD